VVCARLAVWRAFVRVRAALRFAVLRWRLAAERLARALRCAEVVVRLVLPLVDLLVERLRLLLVLRRAVLRLLLRVLC
jgi:hypothetical protein